MFLIYWHKNFRVSPPNTTFFYRSQKDQARPGYPHFLPCIHWQLAAAVVLSHGLVLALLVLDPQIRILNDAEHFRFQIPEVESTFFYISECWSDQQNHVLLINNLDQWEICSPAWQQCWGSHFSDGEREPTTSTSPCHALEHKSLSHL